jgi:hypothetical protein
MTLDEQDIIRIKRPDSNLWATNAVNFNYILRTGLIPEWTDSAGNHCFYHLDWHKDDAFTRALETIEQRSSERIRESNDLQQLLAKTHWSKADREKWEEGVSQIVAEETARIPGFANYRTCGNEKSPDRTDAQDITCLNDLSSDIEHNTEKLRFDCGVESIIKGVTIQKLENTLLPAQAAPTDFKKAFAYFYAAGGATFYHDNEAPDPHSSIFTPSGNTIEATNTGYSYVRSLYDDSTLERLVRGKAFFARDGSVYDQPEYGPPADVPRSSAKRAHDSDREDGRIFSRSQLWMRDGQDGTRVSETNGGGFILAATQSRDGLRELKIFQKQMVGTPEEGYVMIGYVSDRTHAPLAWRYEDSLTGEKYDFAAAFNRDGVEMTVARENQLPDSGWRDEADWPDEILVHEHKSFPRPAILRSESCAPLVVQRVSGDLSVPSPQAPPRPDKTTAERFVIMAQMRPEYRAYAHAYGLDAEPNGIWNDGTSTALLAMANCGQIDARTAQAIQGMYGPGGEWHGQHVEAAAALAYMKQITSDPALKALTELPLQHRDSSPKITSVTVPA